jgi:hypothetical protein
MDQERGGEYRASSMRLWSVSQKRDRHSSTLRAPETPTFVVRSNCF